MGKYWWVTWIKVLALTAVFAVVIVLGYRQVKKSVADYLVDAPADAKLTDTRQRSCSTPCRSRSFSP